MSCGAPEIPVSLSGDESGWCSDVASTHGAWRHAGVRFLLRRDFAFLNICGGYQALSGVAQWLACWAHNPKVRGSKPRSATLVAPSALPIQAHGVIDLLDIHSRTHSDK